jgi:hypothetical protein
MKCAYNEKELWPYMMQVHRYATCGGRFLKLDFFFFVLPKTYPMNNESNRCLNKNS